MAAVPNPPLVSVEEYLASSYPDGDREYVDGIVVERNVGTPGHSALQKILIVHLAAFEKPLGIAVRLVVCMDVAFPPAVPANVERAIHLYRTRQRIYPARALKGMDGATYIREFNSKMLPGTGPYFVTPADIDKGKSIRIKRLPKYWAEKQRRSILPAAGQVNRRTVGHCPVAIGAGEPNRVVRRNPVQIVASRKNRRRPRSFNPSAAGDPLVWLRLIDARFHLRQKILQTGCAFEIQFNLAGADTA